jgi:FkbH-like protein
VTTYRISPYVQTLELSDGNLLVGHPFFAELSVLQGDIARVFAALAAGTRTPDELLGVVALSEAIIERAITFLRNRHFVLIDGHDEHAEILRWVSPLQHTSALEKDRSTRHRSYRDPTPVTSETLRPRIPFNEIRAVRTLIAGGCLSQASADALQQIGMAYGIRAEVSVTWPANLPKRQGECLDVLIFQPSTSWFMRPLWDDGAFLTDMERARSLEVLKQQLRLCLQEVRTHCAGALLLVQGFSTPTFSPLGSTEFRVTHNFYHIVAELNGVIAEAIRDDPNAILIDEERLLSAVGKLRLMDHSLSVFSHHGALGPSTNACEDRSLEQTFGPLRGCHAPRIFAQAYLDAYLVWSGLGRIKCIVVDLDNTLWPGVAGEPDFDIEQAAHQFESGLFGGIHQALKILRTRGVLLASCSRNNPHDAAEAWQRIEKIAGQHGLAHLLQRCDFAIQLVNWNDKAKNIQYIADTLGLALDSILLIDDSAVERTAVAAALPEIRILGENLQDVRTVLLTDPCLQNNVQTAEATDRTAMVRAQLDRDRMQVQEVDQGAFLRKLNIRLKISRVVNSDPVARIVELIQRTTQFNTTLIRVDSTDVNRWIRDPTSRIYTLEIADCFTGYGVVGACIFKHREIICFVLSCRVIPLRPAVPFLNTIISSMGSVPISAHIVIGSRNLPCRQLYLEAGFDDGGGGHYVLNDLRDLVAIDQSTYSVDVEGMTT